MKKMVGVWLDRRQATIVSLLADTSAFKDVEAVVEHVESDVERRVRLSGGARTRKTPYGPQDVAVDGKQENRTKQQLQVYFRKIAAVVQDADKIFIMGPGEARGEFKRHLEEAGRLGDKIHNCETADKMTQNQIVAKVKSAFKPYL